MKIQAFSTLGEISHFGISGYFVISGFDITGVYCMQFRKTEAFWGFYSAIKKIHNSLTHRSIMQIYIPKYPELLTSYLPVIQ